ncbi:hepatoma-derived growth factor, related protein 3, isoform CRA_b [Rattus norvegicus]|uniref:Hepatoma-derived growth factor, related protein 3, isoform CRA_b n=1 Tax=Rattus norvegicus TaxID=10116 RepID=A6JCI8_RAT|nr:hepatoma-derived growth factor, related protein 3, isoform CRA_b [Rattus norvegicus]
MHQSVYCPCDITVLQAYSCHLAINGSPTYSHISKYGKFVKDRLSSQLFSLKGTFSF